MPLKVIIIGAGLGGLGAAIALNRAGHEVQVIEQSGFLNEVGAAIHVAPNATRILKAWGCDMKSLQSVHCDKLQVWSSSADLLWTPVVAKEMQAKLGLQDEWLLTHRVDLHNALRETASQEVNGRKPNIILSSRVVSVDADAGEVVLQDGTKYVGDLVVGADGIHSRTVAAVSAESQGYESTGQNTFRFLVPVEKMQAHPLTAELLKKIGLDGVHAFVANDRRLVAYPCRDGKLLNVAGIHPAGPDTGARHSSWLDSGNHEQLMQTFDDFGEDLKQMCYLAEDVKLWSLASRAPPRKFVRGKLALIGDAAHPMLPHQGQGAAQAFEDGAALGGLFPAETTPEQVSERLEMYNTLRYDHAVTVMMMSKTHHERRAEMLGELRTYVPNAVVPPDMFTYTWPSNPMEDAAVLLQEHQQLGMILHAKRRVSR